MYISVSSPLEYLAEKTLLSVCALSRLARDTTSLQHSPSSLLIGAQDLKIIKYRNLSNLSKLAQICNKKNRMLFLISQPLAPYIIQAISQNECEVHFSEPLSTHLQPSHFQRYVVCPLFPFSQRQGYICTEYRCSVFVLN